MSRSKERRPRHMAGRTARKPGMRGWAQPWGGEAGVIEPAPEWRGTSVQVCGLWPFATGVGTPMIGVPLGHHIMTGATVCADPVSWFKLAALIPNPSMMVLGKPGLGKSTLIRRTVLGLAGFGVLPLVLGDLKPDYAPLIAALGGTVRQVGPGRGAINVLDPGAAAQAAKRLTGSARRALLSDAKSRRLTLVAALVSVNRRRDITDHEENILAAAIDLLDARMPAGQATLHHLIDVLEQGPDEVRAVTLARGDDQRYRAEADDLQRSLQALAAGAMGDVFARPTTDPVDLARPACIDISTIPESAEKLAAAVLLACWAEGFASISALQALTDAGLERQHNFVVVLDELWRVLRAGSGMVDRVDALTRLDRNTGVGTIMATHSIKDPLAVPAKDLPKAKGFVERMGYYALFGMPRTEIELVHELVHVSQSEADALAQWSTPPAWDPATGREAAPPGRGKVLLKVGERPGIPVAVKLTSLEHAVNDTNARWTDQPTRPAPRPVEPEDLEEHTYAAS